ncbi:SsgA family sporulation/cell division regulator [Streptomyces sp. NPDC013433]|uniref:SsgA family sporulation/cell division regulator n=1 Tax=Streptomyces sp. NPDC013433 TaxID=3155604 RepID=UPI001C2149D6|nr:SsgA family sporulation/cell division regulator [Streptomyces sp. AC558_RSS880]
MGVVLAPGGTGKRHEPTGQRASAPPSPSARTGCGEAASDALIFARGLLEEGQRVESGEGDVIIVPCGPGRTGVELRTPSGRA